MVPFLVTLQSHPDPGLFVQRTLLLGSISVAGGRAPRSPPLPSRHDAARDDPKRGTGAECRDAHATATPVLARGQGSAMTRTVRAMGKAVVLRNTDARRSLSGQGTSFSEGQARCGDTRPHSGLDF